jgi:hypothetical protein
MDIYIYIYISFVRNEPFTPVNVRRGDNFLIKARIARDIPSL